MLDSVYSARRKRPNTLLVSLRPTNIQALSAQLIRVTWAPDGLSNEDILLLRPCCASHRLTRCVRMKIRFSGVTWVQNREAESKPWGRWPRWRRPPPRRTNYFTAVVTLFTAVAKPFATILTLSHRRIIPFTAVWPHLSLCLLFYRKTSFSPPSPYRQRIMMHMT